MFMCSHRVKDLECGKKPFATNSNDSYTNKIALRREHWNLQRKIGFIFHETIHFHSASLFYSLWLKFCVASATLSVNTLSSWNFAQLISRENLSCYYSDFEYFAIY